MRTTTIKCDCCGNTAVLSDGKARPEGWILFKSARLLGSDKEVCGRMCAFGMMETIHPNGGGIHVITVS